MIDFQSGGLLARLGPSDLKTIAPELAPILVEGETVHLTFKGIRDSVAFTNKRREVPSDAGIRPTVRPGSG